MALLGGKRVHSINQLLVKLCKICLSPIKIDVTFFFDSDMDIMPVTVHLCFRIYLVQAASSVFHWKNVTNMT
jgi:hypothetical protein